MDMINLFTFLNNQNNFDFLAQVHYEKINIHIHYIYDSEGEEREESAHDLVHYLQKYCVGRSTHNKIKFYDLLGEFLDPLIKNFHTKRVLNQLRMDSVLTHITMRPESGEQTIQTMGKHLERKDRMFKREFKEHKRVYKPQERDSALEKKIHVRKQKFEESKIKMQKSDYMPKHSDGLIVKNREQRQRAREEYAKRTANRPKRTYFNPQFCPELTLSQRLNLITKHRKCKCHKLRFNTIWIKEGVIKVGCDRKEHPEARILEDYDCFECGRKKTVSHYNREECDCTISRCSWCKFETYSTRDRKELFCCCDVLNRKMEELAKVKQASFANTSAWGPLPNNDKIGEEDYDRDLAKRLEAIMIRPEEETLEMRPESGVDNDLDEVSLEDNPNNPFINNDEDEEVEITVSRSEEPTSVLGGISTVVAGAKDIIVTMIKKVRDTFSKVSVMMAKAHFYTMLKVDYTLKPAILKVVKARVESAKAFCKNLAWLNTMANSFIEIFNAFISLLCKGWYLIPAVVSAFYTLATKPLFSAGSILALSSLISFVIHANKDCVNAMLVGAFERLLNLIMDDDLSFIHVKHEKTHMRPETRGEGLDTSFWKKFVKFISFFKPGPFNVDFFVKNMSRLNVIASFKKNLFDFLNWLGQLFPKIFGTFLKASDMRYYIRTQLEKQGSPFYNLNKAAFVALMAQQTGKTEKEISRTMREYQDSKKELLAYLQEQNIALDSTLLRWFRDIEDMVMLRGVNDADKTEPFVIRLCGDAGVGKSTLTVPVASAVFVNKSRADIENLIYYRNTANSHWDGCTKDKQICVYDDFNQDREEVDLREMIGIASNADFRPEYSGIEAKERRFTGIKGDVVNFKLVILHSNPIEINPITLNSKEAINRRKNVIYKLGFRSDWPSRVPDPNYAHVQISKLSRNYQRSLCTWTGPDAIKYMLEDINVNYRAFLEKEQVVKNVIDNFMYKPGEVILPEFNQTPAYNPNITTISNDETLVSTSVVRQRQSPLVQMRPETDPNLFDNDDPLSYIRFSAVNLMGLLLAGCTLTAHAWHISSTIIEIFLYGAWYKKLLFSFLFVGTLFALIPFFCNIVTGMAPESGENRDSKQSKPIRLKVGNGKEKEEETPVHMRSEAAERSVAVNTIVFGIKTKAGVYRTQKGLFIKDNIVLLNKHAFFSDLPGSETYFRKGTPARFCGIGMSEFHNFEFDPSQLVELKMDNGNYCDAVLYKLPLEVPARKTLIHHFWDGSYDLTGMEVVSIQYDTDYPTFSYSKISKDQMSISTAYDRNGLKRSTMVHSVFFYSGRTTLGDCGSVVMSSSDSTLKPIFGIHIGSAQMPTGRISIGTIITRKMLEEGIEQYTDVFERLEPESGHASWVTPTEKVLRHRKLAGQLSIHAISTYKAMPMTKTKIIPSPLHGQIVEVKTKPCNLNTNIIERYQKKMEKYGNPSRPLDNTKVNLAAKSIIEELNGIETRYVNRILTQDEAINGIQGMPYLDSMDMTTSPGFPNVEIGVTGEKRQMFEGTAGSYRPGPILQQQINLILDRCSKRILPDFPFTNMTKDERKSIEEVDKGKVRMFSMNSAAMVVVMRMYFLPTIARLYQCRANTFVCIGMDKASREWDIMIRRLLEVNNRVDDADYEGFDTKASIRARHALLPLFKSIAKNKRDHDILETLYRFDAQALHQWMDLIIAIPSGTSSGSILTAIIGSLINEVYIRYSWLTIFEDTNLFDLMYYRKYVRTKNYGDDLAMTVHPEVEDYFNCQEVSLVLGEYGIVMTSGDKKGVIEPKPVEEFTFLKNKTGLLNGVYVPLAQDPFEQTNWIRTGLPPDQACEDNCNSALRASFFYGGHYFQTMRNKILEVKPHYNLIDYGPLLEQWNSTGALVDADGTFSFSKSQMSIREQMNRRWTSQVLAEDM